MSSALAMLVGSSQAFSLNTVPYVGTRASVQMAALKPTPGPATDGYDRLVYRSTWETNFGDNVPSRLEQLSKPGSSELVHSPAFKPTPGPTTDGYDRLAYRSTWETNFGDNTPARLEELSAPGSAELTRDSSPPVKPTPGPATDGYDRLVYRSTWETNFGDNTPARLASLNKRA